MLETLLQIAVVLASFVPGAALVLAGLGNLVRRGGTFERGIERALKRSGRPWLRLPSEGPRRPFDYAVRIPAGILFLSVPDPNTTSGRLVKRGDRLIRFSAQTPGGAQMTHAPEDLNDEAHRISRDLLFRARAIAALVCSGKVGTPGKSTDTGLVRGPSGLLWHVRELARIAPTEDATVGPDWEKLERRAEPSDARLNPSTRHHRIIGAAQLAGGPAVWAIVYLGWQMHAF